VSVVTQPTSPPFPGDPFVPRPTVSYALRRHWLLASLPVVVFVGLAVAAGLKRPPTYTADAHLAVGRLNTQSSTALVGFAQVTVSLAETYSRSLGSPDIVVPAARRLRMNPQKVLSRISAAPIPDSPVFRVRAHADFRGDAIRIANALSQSLVRYARDRARPSLGQRGVLRRYRETLVRLENERTLLDKRARDFSRRPTPTNGRGLASARASVGTLALQLRTLQQTYEAGEQGPQSSALVSIVDRATHASSDRFSVLQLLVFVALVVGGVIGTALAVFRANRRFRLARA
jgi:uncharacterized protein involved in exopolysaccharide biosynthesis